MRRPSTSLLAPRLLGTALLALSLAGCTTYMPGFSSFGRNELAVAEVPNIGTFTAAGALDEAKNHFRSNDFGYSAALYKRYVELQPTDPQGYVGLAASYDRLQRFDLADRAYASLYRLTGPTAQYYNNVGYSDLLRGNLTAALEAFRHAQKLDPNNVVVANNIEMLSSGVTSMRG